MAFAQVCYPSLAQANLRVMFRPLFATRGATPADRQRDCAQHEQP